MRTVEDQLRAYGDYAEEHFSRTHVDTDLGIVSLDDSAPVVRSSTTSGLRAAVAAAALVLAGGALSFILLGGIEGDVVDETPSVPTPAPLETVTGRISAPVVNGPGGLEWTAGEQDRDPPLSMHWWKGSMRTGYVHDGWYSADGLTWSENRSVEGSLDLDAATGEWALDHDWDDLTSRIVHRTDGGWVPVEVPAHPELSLLPPDKTYGTIDEASVPVVSGESVLIPGSLSDVDPLGRWPVVGWVSVDGISFEPLGLPYPLTRAVALPAGGFAVFPSVSDRTYPVFTSPDGVSWEPQGSAAFLTDDTRSYDIAWQGASLVALTELESGAHVTWRTQDGVNWTRLSDAVIHPPELTVVEIKDYGLMAIHEDYVSFDQGVTWHETPRMPSVWSPPEGCGAGGTGMTHDMLYVQSCGVWVGRFAPELAGG